MSFESDLNQYGVFDKIKKDYNARLCEKYGGRTFTVLTPPHAMSYFEIGKSYTIDGFTVCNNWIYIIHTQDGMNRTIRPNCIKLNSLDSPD